MADNKTFEIKLLEIESDDRALAHNVLKKKSKAHLKALNAEDDTNTIIHRLNTSVYRLYGIEISKIGLIAFLTIIISIAILELIAFNTILTGRFTGFITSIPVFILFTLASKNSIWSYLLGISWDRTLIIHKICGLVTLAAGLVHFYVNFHLFRTRISGVYLYTVFLSTTLLSLYAVRRKAYSWFIRIHVVLATFAAIIAAIHGAKLVVLGFILWVVDMFVRFKYFMMYQKSIVKADIVSKKEVIELKISINNFKHKLGQFIYLWVPSVSYWELHPFSIASEPDEKCLTLYIKPNGPWTQLLYQIGQSNDEIKLGLDGPYGSLPFNIDGSQYKHFLLIAGGIGITPIKALLNYLSRQYLNDRNISSIMVLWSFKDLALVNNVLRDNESFFDYLESSTPQMRNDAKEPMIKFKLFLTSKSNDLTPKKFIPIQPTKYTLELGRPNLGSYFNFMRSECKKAQQKRVLAMCCGPSQMIEDVSLLCRKKSNKDVLFDFDSQVFEF